ncbi:hypothetical protein WN51_13760 [Melipona quadrifasciata]|uniref:Uncharacterized protein n=1 Tax=Melipona quadrifasciata TaxID=166423 RepID=A0A0N0U521_9HYME|nr:hypothetical protein WN51_13760 [Melipona quadrifasciata]
MHDENGMRASMMCDIAARSWVFEYIFSGIMIPLVARTVQFLRYYSVFNNSYVLKPTIKQIDPCSKVCTVTLHRFLQVQILQEILEIVSRVSQNAIVARRNMDTSPTLSIGGTRARAALLTTSGSGTGSTDRRVVFLASQPTVGSSHETKTWPHHWSPHTIVWDVCSQEFGKRRTREFSRVRSNSDFMVLDGTISAWGESNVYISNNVNSQFYHLIIWTHNHTDATTVINQMLRNDVHVFVKHITTAMLLLISVPPDIDYFYSEKCTLTKKFAVLSVDRDLKGLSQIRPYWYNRHYAAILSNLPTTTATASRVSALFSHRLISVLTIDLHPETRSCIMCRKVDRIRRLLTSVFLNVDTCRKLNSKKYIETIYEQINTYATRIVEDKCSRRSCIPTKQTEIKSVVLINRTCDTMIKAEIGREKTVQKTVIIQLDVHCTSAEILHALAMGKVSVQHLHYCVQYFMRLPNFDPTRLQVTYGAKSTKNVKGIENHIKLILNYPTCNSIIKLDCFCRPSTLALPREQNVMTPVKIIVYMINQFSSEVLVVQHAAKYVLEDTNTHGITTLTRSEPSYLVLADYASSSKISTVEKQRLIPWKRRRSKQNERIPSVGQSERAKQRDKEGEKEFTETLEVGKEQLSHPCITDNLTEIKDFVQDGVEKLRIVVERSNCHETKDRENAAHGKLSSFGLAEIIKGDKVISANTEGIFSATENIVSSGGLRIRNIIQISIVRRRFGADEVITGNSYKSPEESPHSEHSRLRLVLEIDVIDLAGNVGIGLLNVAADEDIKPRTMAKGGRGKWSNHSINVRVCGILVKKRSHIFCPWQQVRKYLETLKTFGYRMLSYLFEMCEKQELGLGYSTEFANFANFSAPLYVHRQILTRRNSAIAVAKSCSLTSITPAEHVELHAIENRMCLEKLRIVAKLPFEPVLRSFVEKGTVTTFEERKQDCEVKGQPGTLLSNGRQTEVESGKLKAESRKGIDYAVNGTVPEAKLPLARWISKEYSNQYIRTKDIKFYYTWTVWAVPSNFKLTAGQNSEWIIEDLIRNQFDVIPRQSADTFASVAYGPQYHAQSSQLECNIVSVFTGNSLCSVLAFPTTKTSRQWQSENAINCHTMSQHSKLYHRLGVSCHLLLKGCVKFVEV